MVRLTIEQERCKGCGLCVRACPKGLLQLAGHVLNAKGYHPSALTDLSACTACTACARTCPEVAIAIEKD